jgi:hypothetical protein
VKAALVPEPREARKIAAIECGAKSVRPYAVGDENDYGAGGRWWLVSLIPSELVSGQRRKSV